MKRRAIDKIAAGPELDAIVAEKVMGWKEVRHHGDGSKGDYYIGKKPDKIGRWHQANVPPYSIDQRQTVAVESRVKQLGLWTKYLKSLEKITAAVELPPGWATPEQRCHAALETVGRGRRQHESFRIQRRVKTAKAPNRIDGNLP